VLNNRDLNQVTWEQRVLSGDPKFSVSQDVPAFNYAEYSRFLGLDGIEVKTPEQIRPAYEEALRARRPMVIDAHCDPDVPPLPPHINFEQARAYMSALIQGDPDEMGIINQSAKQMISQFLTRLKT
jgi:pyruvate dehydrogenase (quinone)